MKAKEHKNQNSRIEKLARGIRFEFSPPEGKVETSQGMKSKCKRQVILDHLQQRVIRECMTIAVERIWTKKCCEIAEHVHNQKELPRKGVGKGQVQFE